jgi:hypothetical protein
MENNKINSNDELEIELTESELKQFIKNGLEKLMETSSDSLTNKHGENLKPEDLEEDSQTIRHQASQRKKIGKTPLGKHAPHSPSAKK